MRAKATLNILLLITMALTGCIGGDEGDVAAQSVPEGAEGLVDGVDDALTGEDGEEAMDPGAQPEWTHGDWWQYDVTFDVGFGPLIDGPVKVVLHDKNNGYKVAAADRDSAMVDQYFDAFFIGDLNTDLSAKVQGSTHKMFDFPLEDGKQWTITTLDGTTGSEVQIGVTATAIESTGDPKANGPGYVIEGTNDDGTVHVRYVYSPEAQWVTEYTLHGTIYDNEGNAQMFEVLSMTLTDRGSNYQGTFTILESETLYQRVVSPFFILGVPPNPQGAGLPPSDTVTINEGPTFVHRVVAIGSFAFEGQTATVHRVDILDPNQQMYQHEHINEGFSVWLDTDEPPLTGDWHINYEGGGTSFAFVQFTAFTEEIVEFTASSHANHG